MYTADAVMADTVKFLYMAFACNRVRTTILKQRISLQFSEQHFYFLVGSIKIFKNNIYKKQDFLMKSEIIKYGVRLNLNGMIIQSQKHFVGFSL